jgi:2-polyprenyl-6-methoxyphenol hydroxylase-like FAD-dependent oxidoreductase
MTFVGAHAVVLGAGMSGLTAARVLADHFEHVTVVERDKNLVDGPRHGVPQGLHPHALLLRTTDLLETLFPGLYAQCVHGGGVQVGMLDQHRIRYYGHQLCQAPIGRDALWASRPFLEHRVRERVRDRDNVTFRQGWAADGPVAPTPDRIVGVTISSAGGSQRESLPADLVIDATGRSARTRSWLRDLGYAQPAEQRTNIRLSYATQVLICPADALQGDGVVALTAEPSRPQGLVFVVQEHGRWLLTTYGYGEHRPDANQDYFSARVRALAPDDVMAVIDDSEPASRVNVFQVPYTYRRRYEAMSRFPEGLLVVGDALCTVNPVYGAGMMNAAAEAVILDRRLNQGLNHIRRGFFRDAARVIGPSWWLSTVFDTSFPGVVGPRVPGARLACWYIRHLVAAAEKDPVLAAEFMRVAGSGRAPTTLLYPRILKRVMTPLLKTKHERPLVHSRKVPETG